MATISKHGVFVALNPGAIHSEELHSKFSDTLGVLITGRSGIGKSELALNLIHRGHSLVADDAPLLNRQDNEIIGRCSDTLQDFLDVQDLGVLNIRFLFGAAAIKTSQRLDLIAHLVDAHETTPQETADAADTSHSQCILDLPIPKHIIPIKPGRHLALWVECIALNQQLQARGYDAGQDLQNRLDQIIARQASCA